MYFFPPLVNNWRRDPRVRKILPWKMTGEPESREKLADSDHLEKTVMEQFWQIHQPSNMPTTFIPNP